jgi:eukaryotic-like serine/threonine-protein kinase
MLSEGTVVLGKYCVDSVIGVGGMGEVVRASHLYLDQTVAIKTMLPEHAKNHATVARFLREAQANVRLRSEHIVRVLDVGTLPGGPPFFVMEYLEGNDLNQILAHHGPQPANVVCDLMQQACVGLAEAHSMGIVHRDIKPSNFFVTQRPDGSMLLKILDFGISKEDVPVEALTSTQTVMGTPIYMAPEQMKSGRRADARSDIWSMGVVMYQLIQGDLPFSGETYADLVLKVGTEDPAPMTVEVPGPLKDIILRCMARDPADRHQTVAKLAVLLAPFSSDPANAAQIATRTARTFVQGSIRGPRQTSTPLAPALLTPLPTPVLNVRPNEPPPSELPPSESSPSDPPVIPPGQEPTRQAPRFPIWVVASMFVVGGLGGLALGHAMRDEVPGSAKSPSVEVPSPVAEPIAAPRSAISQPIAAPLPPPAPIVHDAGLAAPAAALTVEPAANK